MNILSITAGAADMYCGSCLRDNALAAALLARGHRVTLLPVYTPTITDEPNVSGRRVFFGGISVYLEQHVPLFRWTPRLLDRLWDAPGVIRALARRSIQVDPKMLGALTVSTLKGEDGYQRKEFDKLLDWLRDEPAPDVVNLPNSLLIALAGPLKRALGCPVVVTLQGEDLFLDGLPPSYRTEALALIRRHVDHVDGFVAVSEYYAGYMSEYLGIPADRIRTAPLGVNVDDLAPTPRRRGTPFVVGYLARVAPEKGLHVLAEAYRLLRQKHGLPASRLVVAGYMSGDHRAYLDNVRGSLARAGLGEEFEYVGTVTREGKVRFLHGVDVVSVPTVYKESKGLSLLEAMACGVPIVQPAHGTFPEMIRKTGGGLLVASNQAADVAEGLLTLWGDPERAGALGRHGAAGVREHYTVQRMADRMLEVYAEIAGGVRPAAVGS